MRYIFIDTNIYMQKQFDFNNAIFISLIDMVENNQIRVLTTSVSNSEVKKKIKDKLKGEIKDFKPKLIKTEKIYKEFFDQHLSLETLNEVFLKKNLRNL